MTIMDEHNAKMAWIADPANNKYDYGAYKQFCLANNFEVMSFATYALTIEPPPVMMQAQPAAPVATPCGSCGGGKVR